MQPHSPPEGHSRDYTGRDEQDFVNLAPIKPIHNSRCLTRPVRGWEARTVGAGATTGPVGNVHRRLVRPRQSLITASGWAALLTGALAIWVATELRIAGTGWLPWLAIALPPVAAGALCLARRRATTLAPAAVLASCAVTSASAVTVPDGRSGLVLAASVLLLLCAGVTVVISAIVTTVLVGVMGAVTRRRAAVWAAAGLVFAGLSIPSPIHVTGGPIQTIFAGNTRGESTAAVCYLVLLALPLLVAGLASARMATVIAVAWLPGAAAQLLGWYVFPFPYVHLDAWYYVSWLAWLAIAVLTLAEALSWRSVDFSEFPETPPRADNTGPSDT
jgi:hypothetical protein